MTAEDALGALGTRVRHVVSGTEGALEACGLWYAAVRFDGDTAPSSVSIDSIKGVDNSTDSGVE